MGRLTMTELETFGVNVLENETFTVQWDKTETVKKKTKSGGDYNQQFIVVNIEGISNPLKIGPLFGKDWDNIRLLRVKGITKYSCTAAIKDKETGYDRFVFSGAKSA